MQASALAIEAFVAWLGDHPDVAMLAIIIVGAYYEIHHGRIAKMAENQTVLGLAVYKLMQREDGIDAEAFREDLHGNDDGGYHPGDWDSAEPPDEKAKP